MPLWAQLLGVLRERLERGEYVSAFPTDVELTKEFGVSRHTVREAVRRLHDDGVVLRERGRRTSVRPVSIEQPMGAIYSLFRSIEAQGRDQRSKVLGLAEVVAPDVSQRLGLTARSRLVRLERLRCVDGQPLAHDTAWLPATIARPLLGVDFTHTALYDELARQAGVRPTSGSEWVHAELPTPADRALLGLPARHPVFAIQRLSLSRNRPIEWRETVVRGDAYTFVAHWKNGGGYHARLAPRSEPARSRNGPP